MNFKFNRETFPVVGLTGLAAILFFFRIPVSQLLNTIIVKPLFIGFESGIWTEILLVLFLLMVIFWAAKEQPKGLLRCFVLYCLVFYFFQRNNSYWKFIHLQTFPTLAYWDIVAFSAVLLLPISYLLQKTGNDLRNKAQNNQGFVEDNAVTNLDDDHFRRRNAAKEIAKLIKLTQNRKSFAIGILGEYGSGKTSFLNIINLELGNDEVMKIAFDPWGAGNPENLRREFFDLLAREVAKVDLKISSLIYSYGRKLASFDARSSSWLNWINFFSNRGSIQTSGEYQQINNMLKATGRKIIITIDDLDRLYPSEIIEVLKLIRNTADFSNVFYLVGYDKVYVQGAIKTLSETGGMDYLDKIFQLEIPLPKREEDDLLDLLQLYLKEIISVEHFSFFVDSMIPNGFRSRYEKAYKGILRQGRDVVRFTNSFKIIYNLIGDEIDFECLILLELIKFRFSSIYEAIYTQREVFLYEQSVRASHQHYYSPRMIKDSKSEKDAEEVSSFRKYIQELKWLSAEDISLLDALFMALFKGRYHAPESKNSISYPLYFEVYFRYRLSQRDLSDKDFRAAIISGHMRKYMAYCASNELHKELMIRLMQEEINKNRLHFENVIHWIFSFGRTYVDKEGMFRFDYEALIDKIYNYHDHITDKLYKRDKNIYKNFINNLFNIALPPYLFENELIYYLKRRGEGFALSLKELNSYQYLFFTRMADSDHRLNEQTIWIFWSAREHYRIPADKHGAYYEKWKFEPKLAMKMKEFLAVKDSKEFLKFSIQQDMHDHSKVCIVEQVMEIFNDPMEYRNLISKNTLLNNEIKTEYLELFDQLAKNNFKQYVTLELKTELNKPQND